MAKHKTHKKKKTKKTVFGKKKSKSKTKRPLNEYFKLMLDAKKKGLKEFKYKNHTYLRKVVKSPRSGAELVVYKKK